MYAFALVAFAGGLSHQVSLRSGRVSGKPSAFRVLDTSSVTCERDTAGRQDESIVTDNSESQADVNEAFPSVITADSAHSISCTEDPLKTFFSSSRVERNLRRAARRVRKTKHRQQSDFFEKASVFYLTDTPTSSCPRQSDSFSSAQNNILEGLGYVERENSGCHPLATSDIVDRFDAFSVPRKAGSKAHEAESVLHDADSDSSTLVKQESVLIESALSNHPIMSVCKSPSPSVVYVSDGPSTGDGDKTNSDVSSSFPDQHESTLLVQDVSLWHCVDVDGKTFRTPDFEPPSRTDVEHSATDHGLPSCMRQDAVFSNPNDYRGPKMVGATRICVPSLTAAGDEVFDTQKVTSMHRSWSGLVAWRSKVNEDNLLFWHIAPTLDLSSINMLNPESVRLCAEQRSQAVRQQTCWLTPASHPPSRASVATWGKRRRSLSRMATRKDQEKKKGSTNTPGKKEHSEAAEASQRVVKDVDGKSSSLSDCDLNTISSETFSKAGRDDSSTGASGASTQCLADDDIRVKNNESPSLSTTFNTSPNGSESDDGFLVPTQILPSVSADSSGCSSASPGNSSVFQGKSSDSCIPAGQRVALTSGSDSCSADTSADTAATLRHSETASSDSHDSLGMNRIVEPDVPVNDRRNGKPCAKQNIGSGRDQSATSCQSFLADVFAGPSPNGLAVSTSAHEAGGNKESAILGSTRIQENQLGSPGSDGLEDSLLLAAVEAAEPEGSSSTRDESISAANSGQCPNSADVQSKHTSATDDRPLSMPVDSESPIALCQPSSSQRSCTSSSDPGPSSQSTVICSSEARSSPASESSTTLKSALRSASKRRRASAVSFSDGHSDSDHHHQQENRLSAAKRQQLELFKRRSPSSSLRTPPPKRRRSSQLKSQIDGPSLANEHGFQVSMLDLGEAHSVHESQFLTLLAVEIHTCARGQLLPDPQVDAVCALFYTLDWELGGGRRETLNGLMLVDSSSLPFSRYGLTIDRHEKVENEQQLFDSLLALVDRFDPDILLGYEVQKQSWGYLLQRANVLDIPFLNRLSRLVEPTVNKPTRHQPQQQKRDDRKDENEAVANAAGAYMARKMTELRVPGRIILNVWRLMRHEAALTSYSLSSVAFHILHVRLPKYSFSQLACWFDDDSTASRSRVLEFYLHRCHYTMQLLRRLDLVARTSEMARLFGLQFYEVLTRGSQFRVESMMLRLTKQENLVAFSPSVQERACMNAPECIPLILEPESRFYTDPVVVLDFQSLYPSMMIAYNYCFSTCLGRVASFAQGVDRIKFGCSTLRVEPSLLKDLGNDVTISPNGVVFVKKHVRHGILPR